MEKTIAQEYGIIIPKAASYKGAPITKEVDAKLLFGVELEIENTRQNEWKYQNFIGKEDGSLRNNGFEYVTSPMTYNNTVYGLQGFFTKYKITSSNYSERCSVHVHTNCLDLTWNQLSTILLLYQVYERVLYRFIGHERDNNIFSVPWHQTVLTYQLAAKLKKTPTTIAGEWQKYTGLNLLRLQDLGTLEWRHMQGNCDVDYIATWLRIISRMFVWARTHTLEETEKMLTELNTTSAYADSLYAVFQDETEHLITGDYKDDLERGVLALKFSFVENTPTTGNLQGGALPINTGRVAAAAPPQLAVPPESATMSRVRMRRREGEGVGEYMLRLRDGGFSEMLINIMVRNEFGI